MENMRSINFIKQHLVVPGRKVFSFGIFKLRGSASDNSHYTDDRHHVGEIIIAPMRLGSGWLL